MRKSRFSEEQITGILAKARAGMRTIDVCSKHGITRKTLYSWRAKYGSLQGRSLSYEGDGDAHLALRPGRCQASGRTAGGSGNHQGKVVSLKSKRSALTKMREKLSTLSIRSACKLLGFHQSTYSYKPTKQKDDEALKAKIVELATAKPHDGRPAITWRLRERLGFKDNPKRIARTYRELELQVASAQGKSEDQR